MPEDKVRFFVYEGLRPIQACTITDTKGNTLDTNASRVVLFWGTLAKKLQLCRRRGERSRDFSHARQVSEPLHYRIQGFQILRIYSTFIGA